jgi:hypothetical protein
MPVSASWVAAIKDWLRPRGHRRRLPPVPGRLARQHRPGVPRPRGNRLRQDLLNAPRRRGEHRAPQRHRVITRDRGLLRRRKIHRQDRRVRADQLTQRRELRQPPDCPAPDRSPAVGHNILPGRGSGRPTSRPRAAPGGCRFLNSIGRGVRMVWCAVFPMLRFLLGTSVWLDLARRRDGQKRIVGPFTC